MRLTRFSASKVHGYISFEIDFFEDLTFLIGLNGCGKTTALRLILALLSPSLDVLVDIAFETASLTVRATSDVPHVIIATKSPKHISLAVSGIDEEYHVDLPMMGLEPTDHRRNEILHRVESDARSHPVFKLIRSLPTPMFLGLERRHAASERLLDRERYYTDGILFDDAQQRRARVGRSSEGTSLDDVQELVRDTMARLAARQSATDNDLRKRIILDAFSYEHADTHKMLGQGQSQLQPSVLRSFQDKQKSIEKAAGSLGVPVEQVQQRLNDFFERMNGVVADMAAPGQPTGQGKQKHGKPQTTAISNRQQVATLEWLINKPQVDRIWKLFRLMEEYVTTRDQETKPIENFLRLVNGFLKQTGKLIVLDSRNYLNVLIAGSEDRRAITTLSSGERQILVMLAHLSLNERLMDKGVFIVDEPELSLHIAWQEMFVAAIHEASPDTQIVLATHSPAIILERDAQCRDLTRGVPSA